MTNRARLVLPVEQASDEPMLVAMELEFDSLSARRKIEMDSYGLVLFLHLCALLGAIGTAALLHYAEVRLRAANSAATIQSWAGLIEKGARVFPLALVVLLGSGAYLVHRRWSWSAGWVEAALIGVGVLFVVGAGVVGDRSRALKRELRGAEGASTRGQSP